MLCYDDKKGRKGKKKLWLCVWYNNDNVSYLSACCLRASVAYHSLTWYLFFCLPLSQMLPWYIFSLHTTKAPFFFIFSAFVVILLPARSNFSTLNSDSFQNYFTLQRGRENWCWNVAFLLFLAPTWGKNIDEHLFYTNTCNFLQLICKNRQTLLHHGALKKHDLLLCNTGFHSYVLFKKWLVGTLLGIERRK